MMVNLFSLKDGEQTNNNKKDIACSTDSSPALLGSGLAAQVKDDKGVTRDGGPGRGHSSF